LHDTLYVVGHFHVVLSIGAVFGILSGITLWWRVFYGCEFNLVLRIVSSLSVFIGVVLTFIPIHIAGLQCTPRRYSDYCDILMVNWILCNIGAITSFTGITLYSWSLISSTICPNTHWLWSNIASTELTIPRPQYNHTFTSTSGVIF
jgi:heme/copper-type cytochrome/quinol oxidase subunit 1